MNKARKAILERLAGRRARGRTRRRSSTPWRRTSAARPTSSSCRRSRCSCGCSTRRPTLIAQGEKVRWLPDYMGKRYRNWVENLEWDWCISRQRFYGVPFPFWHCKGCGERGARARRGPAGRPDGGAPPRAVPDVRRRRLRPREGRDGHVGDVVGDAADQRALGRAGRRPARPAARCRCARRRTTSSARGPSTRSRSRGSTSATCPWRDAMISGLVLDADRREDQQVEGQRARRPARDRRQARRRRRPLLGALGEAGHRLPVQRGGPRLGPAPLREALERAPAVRRPPRRASTPRRRARRSAAVDRWIRARLARPPPRRSPRTSTPTSSGSRRAASSSSSGTTSATTTSRW